MPPDVRKGFAFPISNNLIIYRSGEAEPRRCEKVRWERAGKPEAFRTSGGRAAIHTELVIHSQPRPAPANFFDGAQF